MPIRSELLNDQGLVSLVLRRWRTMGLAFTLAVTAGAIAVQAMPKRYESSAKVLIMRTDQRLGGLNVISDSLPELSHLNNPLFTQVELLRAMPVFEETVRKLDLRDDEGRPIAPEALAKGLKVGAVDKTDMITVAYTGPDPAQAQHVVQAVCEAYLSQAEQYRRDGVQDGLKLVDDQLETARKRLQTAENQLLAYKRRSGRVALSEEISASVGEMSTLNQEIRQRQIDLARASAKAASLRSQLGMSSRAGLQAAAVSQDPRIQSLQRQLAEAESSPLKSQGLGPAHPDMIALNQRIAQLKRQLSQATGGGQAPPMDEIRLGLLRDLAAAEADVNASRSSYATAEARRRSLVGDMARYPNQEVALTRLSREVTVAGQIYQQLLQKREEARLSMAIAPTSARVVEPASLPTRPVAPLKGPTAPILGLAGLAVAFCAGALKDLLSRTLRPQDLAGYLQELKIYAALPTLSWAERRHGELLVGTGASPHYVEGLKTLGMALEEQCVGTRGAVIGVSSTLPREGKSVTSANLALALAEAGHRVLLVDADFRRPRVHTLFGLAPGAGLSEVLMEQARATAVVRQAGRIDAVTAGQAPMTASLAKLRHRLGPALAAWRQDYDFVLLDLPPLVVLAEVAQIARHTEGLLMVANLHHVAPEALVAGIQQLQSLRAPVVGIVAISQMLGQPKGGYYLIAGEGLIS